ncbi:MAG TPA: hypothetical protein VIY72_06025 [Acidimicrobiales bacterium]
MSEQAIIDKAQKALGDDDTVVAAAMFEPRGTSAGLIGGSTVGGGIGHALGGGLGGAIGDLAGAALAMETAKHTKDFGKGSGDGATVHQVPWRTLIAVSESRIYGWHVKEKGFHQVPADVMFQLDRSDIVVALKARAAVHVFEVKDTRTGDTWEFEAGRMDSHLKYLVDALHDVAEPASS